MMREETVFGPIHSRRLGNSLGINLLPTKGKVCNFDCIYCECGWNADGRGDTVIPTRAQVRSALEDRLAEMLLDGTPVDSITFSGDGEPTLNPEFAGIIDDTLMLRDTYFPSARVSVLSNATRVHIPSVLAALKKVDNPIMKIDAPNNEFAALINHPAPGYDVRRTVEALKAFSGDFILQTMFLRAPAAFDSSSKEVLEGWMSIVRELKPREVMVYSIDRPTPQAGLESFTYEEIEALVRPLAAEGFKIQISAKHQR